MKYLPLLLTLLFPPYTSSLQDSSFSLQLNLVDCNTTDPTAQIQWIWNNPTNPSGSPLLLQTTGECVTYDPVTTNVIMLPCNNSLHQLYTLRNDGTIFNPTTALCMDVQYYGNTTGSVLGLYTCYPDQAWDLFQYNSTNGLLTNTQINTLCVSGGAMPIVIPSPAQLEWMDKEISLMISYDLITQLTDVPNPQHFCINAGGDSGFPVPSPYLFNPANVTFTDSWMEAAIASNAGYTLLVASHCSGFLQWQSNVTLPDGSPYPYTVKQSYWKGGEGDVVQDYVDSSRKYGFPFGFYLTWNYNYLFNAGCCDRIYPASAPGQINLTLDQYHDVMTATMTEVWTRYENQIQEIWFDGGENNVPLNTLIAQLQPQAIITDGTQGPNYARLVGAESGYAPYPNYCTANGPAADGSGNPAGRYFVPSEADTPVSTKDSWFWKPNQQYRPLDELKAVYRNTVGSNSVLELGVLPDNTGSIPSDQMQVLQSFGDYVRQCHLPNSSIASTNGTGASIKLTFPETTINRIILQEDLRYGEIVMSYTVEILPSGGYDPQPIPVASGLSIGHKRIQYFDNGPIPASAVIVTATSFYPGYTSANWRNVAVYAPCAGDDAQ